jgi:hypothetical protein
MRHAFRLPGLTFYLFIVWKVALLVFATLPIPSGDAFFYDGAVVNYLTNGKYCNPSLAMVLPISSSEVFCAYPPFYQLGLLGWMKVFGTSALAAMTFHLTLVIGLALTILAILRHFKASPAALFIAGLFLFCLTSHDRPDTLAQTLGMLGVFFAVRHRHYAATLFLLLTCCTSLQIGGVYALWVGLLALARFQFNQTRLPIAAGVLFVTSALGLVVLVKYGYPHLWEGFREHVLITPAVTGWRLPVLEEALRVFRVAPGILLVATLLWLDYRRKLLQPAVLTAAPELMVGGAGIIACLALVGASVVLLTANNIHMVAYMQPLLVGCFLSATYGGLGRATPELTAPPTPAPVNPPHIPGYISLSRQYTVIFALAALIVSTRAIGITLWGLVCITDVNHTAAIQIIQREIKSAAPTSVIVVSSAFFYEAARRNDLQLIHADWLGLVNGQAANPSAEKLAALRPDKLLLVQFERYRRYEAALRDLKSHPDLQELSISYGNDIPVPDAYPVVRRLFQNVSWSPVIVHLKWKPHAIAATNAAPPPSATPR